MMVSGYGFPAAAPEAPETLVLVHMVTIGWLSLLMWGALFQFVPVLVAKPLQSAGLVLPALLTMLLGLGCLLAGFLQLSGTFDTGLPLLAPAGVLLPSGFRAGDLGDRAHTLACASSYLAGALCCRRTGLRHRNRRIRRLPDVCLVRVRHGARPRRLQGTARAIARRGRLWWVARFHGNRRELPPVVHVHARSRTGRRHRSRGMVVRNWRTRAADLHRAIHVSTRVRRRSRRSGSRHSCWRGACLLCSRPNFPLPQPPAAKYRAQHQGGLRRHRHALPVSFDTCGGAPNGHSRQACRLQSSIWWLPDG